MLGMLLFLSFFFLVCFAISGRGMFLILMSIFLMAFLARIEELQNSNEEA